MDVGGRLHQLGLNLRPEWVEDVYQSLRAAGVIFSAVDDQVRALVEQFATTEIRLSNKGTLPKDITEWKRCTLAGRHVVQVDELINIAAPSKTRYQGSNSKSYMQMKISDGDVEMAAFEYRSVPFLKHDTPAGCKIAITGAEVVGGILMLTPDNTEMLGGQVQELVEAHKAVATRHNAKAGPGFRNTSGPASVPPANVPRHCPNPPTPGMCLPPVRPSFQDTATPSINPTPSTSFVPDNPGPDVMTAPNAAFTQCAPGSSANIALRANFVPNAPDPSMSMASAQSFAPCPPGFSANTAPSSDIGTHLRDPLANGAGASFVPHAPDTSMNVAPSENRMQPQHQQDVIDLCDSPQPQPQPQPRRPWRAAGDDSTSGDEIFESIEIPDIDMDVIELE